MNCTAGKIKEKGINTIMPNVFLANLGRIRCGGLSIPESANEALARVVDRIKSEKDDSHRDQVAGNPVGKEETQQIRFSNFDFFVHVISPCNI